MLGGKSGSVFQVRLLKKALDETVSYPQNARAPRNVLVAFLHSFKRFPRHFSSASCKQAAWFSCVV